MTTLADTIIDIMRTHQQPSFLWNNGTLSFKELEQVKQFYQKGNETVFAHTMKVLDSLTIKNRITLWAALFHDLGKFSTKVFHENSMITFHGHSEESMVIAHKVLSAWQEDPLVIDRTKRLIQTHMLDLRYATNKTARNLFGKVGKGNIENWFTLREADISAYPHPKTYINMYLKSFRTKVEEYRMTLIRQNDLFIPTSSGAMQICGGE